MTGLKAAGLFLLVAGFAIVASAMLLLSSNAPRSLFVVAGIAVEILGLFLAFRAHYSLHEGH